MENKRVNILIMQTKAFPHRENSFSLFHPQQADRSTRKEYGLKLFYACWAANDYGIK